MLKKHVEMLRFVIENLYISTNAVGIAIIDSMGNVAAECGHLDPGTISEATRNVTLNNRDLIRYFTGMEKDNFFMILKASKGGIVIAPVGEDLCLVAFYPKGVDILVAKPVGADEMRSALAKIVTQKS